MVAQTTATFPTNWDQSGFGASPTGVSGKGMIKTDVIYEFTSASGIQLVSGQVPVGGTTDGRLTFHCGDVVPLAVTNGNDSTAVNTETYIIECYIPHIVTLTGVAWLNLATSTGNVQFALANYAGTVIANSTTASTAAGTGAVWQQVPFSTAVLIKGPTQVYVLMQNSGSNHYRAHTIGNFRAGKKTGEVYGTFTNITVPTGFTTNVAPICDLYV